jgi:hypothetical protein
VVKGVQGAALGFEVVHFGGQCAAIGANHSCDWGATAGAGGIRLGGEAHRVS